MDKLPYKHKAQTPTAPNTNFSKQKRNSNTDEKVATATEVGNQLLAT
jgi:hypothetical protein